jgi:hypothetical protein
MADGFDGYTPPTGLFTRHLSIQLGISDDDVLDEEGQVIGTEVSYNINYSYDILDAEGNLVERKSGAGEKHCTPAEKTALMAFMDAKFQMAKDSLD